MSKELARAIAAQCLGYPEQSFIDRNAELLNMTHALAPKLREPLVKFLTSAAQMPLNQLQQHYVEIFDMRRKCSLFLTSWTHGDTRNRGMALVYFIQIYKRCGLLLSPHVDHLFDRGFISFTQKGELLISSKLNSAVLDDWEIEVPKNVGNFSTSQEDYLSFHRARIFKAS